MGFILDCWLRFNQNRHVRKITGSKITACTFLFTLHPRPRPPPIHSHHVYFRSLGSSLCRALHRLLCHPDHFPSRNLASQLWCWPAGRSHDPDVCACWRRLTAILLSRLQGRHPPLTSLPRWHLHRRSWEQLPTHLAKVFQRHYPTESSY